MNITIALLKTCALKRFYKYIFMAFWSPLETCPVCRNLRTVSLYAQSVLAGRPGFMTPGGSARLTRGGSPRGSAPAVQPATAAAARLGFTFYKRTKPTKKTNINNLHTELSVTCGKPLTKATIVTNGFLSVQTLGTKL